MSKPRFTYRVDPEARMLRIALAKASKGDVEFLARYLISGGKIPDLVELGHALMASKRRRGKPVDTSEAAQVADYILVAESRWRKAHPGNRLPRGYRPGLVERHVQAAWRDDGQWESTYKKMKDPADRRVFEEEYKDLAREQILNALENKRKNKSRKARIKRG